MPHHTPIIVIISVSLGLALVATAVVLAGYFTNWFQSAAGTFAQDPSSVDVSDNAVDADVVDFPSTFLFTNANSDGTILNNQEVFTRVDPPTSGIYISSDDITYPASIILAQWEGSSTNISVLPNQDTQASDGTYIWVLTNTSNDHAVRFTTSNTLDIFSINGTWNSPSSESIQTVMIEPSVDADGF
jgi:hypothetical protein